jgi:copper chaperone NosL
MKKMCLSSRIIVSIASLSLVATYFLPVWFIFLIAPQYPEGLTMNIWLNKITGQVDIINGLNHYIGMKHIKAEMFPEFGFLVYIVGFFILFGFLVAIIGRRSLLYTYLITTVLGGIAAMVDFYKWGYDYGHNLDPKAAIQVPGLSYQPPLFGHKTLLNFDAYSYPDLGGWVVITVGIVFFAVSLYEWFRNRKKIQSSVPAKSTSLIAAGLLIFLSSCNHEPEPFVLGKDACEDCKMTIMDAKFGGEIITKKGRVYTFDDTRCLAHFTKTNGISQDKIALTVVSSYDKPNSFIDVKQAYFVVSEQLHSPMNSNAAAFENKNLAEQKVNKLTGAIFTWDELLTSLK